MKKPSTFYFLLLALANAYIGWIFVTWFNPLMSWHFQQTDAKLPNITLGFLACPWWPWCFTGLFGIGFAISLATKIPSAVLCHPIIVLLTLEVFLLFAAVLAYALPCIPTL